MNGLTKSILCAYFFLVGTVDGVYARTEAVTLDAAHVQTEDGPFLYVANQEAAAITVIDLSTHTVAEIIDLEKMGYGANAKPHHLLSLIHI